MPPAAARRRSIAAPALVGRVLLAVAALGALLVLGRWGGRYVPEFAERVRALGGWGPAAFVAGTWSPPWRACRGRC
jgi:hypothetical protein